MQIIELSFGEIDFFICHYFRYKIMIIMSSWLECLQTLLVCATGVRDIEVVNSSLRDKPDLEVDGLCKETGKMALNAAVVELIRQQLKVEDHFQNYFDWVKQSQFGVIKVLIEHNTCLNIMFPASDKNAIMTAVEFGQTEVVETLIDWGADVNCSCQG